MPTVSSDLLRNASASAADSSGRQTNPKHWPGMGRFPQHTFLRHLEGIAARTPSDLEFGMEDRSQRWESLAATAKGSRHRLVCWLWVQFGPNLQKLHKKK